MSSIPGSSAGDQIFKRRTIIDNDSKPFSARMVLMEEGMDLCLHHMDIGVDEDISDKAEKGGLSSLELGKTRNGRETCAANFDERASIHSDSIEGSRRCRRHKARIPFTGRD